MIDSGGTVTAVTDLTGSSDLMSPEGRIPLYTCFSYIQLHEVGRFNPEPTHSRYEDRSAFSPLPRSLSHVLSRRVRGNAVCWRRIGRKPLSSRMHGGGNAERAQWELYETGDPLAGFHSITSYRARRRTMGHRLLLRRRIPPPPCRGPETTRPVLRRFPHPQVDTFQVILSLDGQPTTCLRGHRPTGTKGLSSLLRQLRHHNLDGFSG